MPTMHISKSIRINAPADQIFNKLNDFNTWQAWSPWLIMEPEANVTVSDDAKYYEWQGARTGEGNMQITSEDGNESMDLDLTFLKPWKSTAKVRFELKQNGEGTEVTWLMDSGLPFFLFWMKKMMTAFVGMDYERGLRMLKEYIEDGEVHSKLEFPGTSDYPGCKYIGIQTNCTIEEVGDKMGQDLEKIWGYLGDKNDLVAGDTLSIYHKWDMVNRQVSYTSAVPVSSVPSDLPAGMISGTIPQTSVHTLRHTGPYAHLGNAWSTLYTMQRNKEFKQNKKIDPFETYRNMPGDVPDNELITEVHFPVK